MKRFLTFFHDDHVHVGAAAAEAASGSRRDVDLTMMLKTILDLRQDFVASHNAEDPSIYILAPKYQYLISTHHALARAYSRREAGRLIKIDFHRLPHILRHRVETSQEVRGEMANWRSLTSYPSTVVTGGVGARLIYWSVGLSASEAVWLGADRARGSLNVRRPTLGFVDSSRF